MIYLIDFENVHEEGFKVLGRLGEKDAVYCFFTRNVAKISMAALAGIRSGQLHFVEAESGKQSLDLALVSFLGYLIGTRAQEQTFEIVSNDNGFNKVADFWNNRGTGIRVRVRKTVSETRTKTDSGKSVVEGAVSHPESNPEKSLETTASEPDNTTAERKEQDASVAAALSAAGLSSTAAEFVLAQAEKYRADKNLKQLVYRAVVKKFGQKTGTQIYNSSKKILLK